MEIYETNFETTPLNFLEIFIYDMMTSLWGILNFLFVSFHHFDDSNGVLFFITVVYNFLTT